MRTYAPGESLEQLRRRSGFSTIVKLNANENPHGSSPLAAEALRGLPDLNLYGDDANIRLRESMGARFGLRASQIVLGHGSNELIALASAVFLHSGDRAVMAIPSFSLFRVGARAQNAEATEIPLRDNRYDIDAMLAAITPDTSIVFICDPNNPTGIALDASQWQHLLDDLPASVMLIVDQAYVEYMDRQSIDAAQLVAQRPKTLVLRTMSKLYGLAALRFGYGFADEKTIEALNARRTPYNVSRPAAAAAAAAFDDRQFVERTLEVNATGKILLTDGLRSLGLDVLASQANFVSVSVPVGADRACADLLSRGIAVRSGDALSMPGRLRITIGTEVENRAVVSALSELLPTWYA